MSAKTHHPLTVRCAFRASERTGGKTATLAAQRKSRRLHASATTEGLPR